MCVQSFMINSDNEIRMHNSPQEIVAPLSWLIGKWRCASVAGNQTTINPFLYRDEIEFKFIGLRMLNYYSFKRHPESDKLLHWEPGFLMIEPATNDITLLLAPDDFGITEEEGIVYQDDCTLELRMTNVSSMTLPDSPVVTELTRSFKLCCDTDELQLVISVTTTEVITERLVVTYVKC